MLMGQSEACLAGNRGFAKLLAAGLALLFGMALGAGFILGTRALFFHHNQATEKPPCFELGSPFHHRFQPNCSGTVVYSNGPARISVNEDGMREIPRALALKKAHRVLVMGDSFVEGWRVSNESSLPALLTSRSQNRYFLNGGLRSTGPAWQANRLRELGRIYRPELVIWVLNETDFLDDRFACGVAENPTAPLESRRYGTPELQFKPWQEKLLALVKGASLERKLRVRLYQQRWREIADGPLASRCGACDGVRAFREALQKLKIPARTYFVPVNPAAAEQFNYFRAGREALLSCLGRDEIEEGLDLSGQFPADLYWDSDIHLNQEGLFLLASLITKDLNSYAPEKKKARSAP